MGQLICTACGKQLHTKDTICSRCGCHYFHRPQAEDLGTYYQRAFSMRQEGRFADAIRIYQDILAVSHDQVEAHRGITYARYGVVWKCNGADMECEMNHKMTAVEDIEATPEPAAEVETNHVQESAAESDTSAPITASADPNEILTCDETPAMPEDTHTPREIVRDPWVPETESQSGDGPSEDTSSENISYDDIPSVDFSSGDIPSGNISSEDVATKNISSVDAVSKDISSVDIPSGNISSEDAASADIAFRPFCTPAIQVMREESYLEDPDYLQAKDSLNLTQQVAIEEDALPIYQLQQQILEMADTRPAYDIFLCCNPESAVTETPGKAREIYLFLREEGYRVYPVDLESDAASEAAITYALWTAPVMIVVGASEVDFRRPEMAELWHRFQYMSPLRSKLIIPVYPGSKGVDLPSEFSMMPCMDYSVIGFSNRLLRTIDKQFRKPEPNLQEDNRTVARLKKSGQTFLELGNYKQAFAIYEELYTRFPDHYEGWWGMIVSKTRGFTDPHLDQKELNDWYRCARLLSKESPEFAEKEPLFIAYKKQVYGSVIQKDRQNVLDMVDRVNGQIRGIHQASEELEATLARSKKQYNDSNKEMNYRLRQNQVEQDELHARSATCKRFIILGMLISIGGMVLVHDAESVMTSALVFLGFIIIVLSLVNLKFGHVSENLERLEEEEKELIKKRAVYKKKYEEYKETQAETLEGNQYEARRMQAFVVEASQWLDIDDDAIFGNILADEMQGTGLIFHTHPELITQRKELDNLFHQLFQ